MRYVVAALLVALLAPGAAAQNPETSSHTEAVREANLVIQTMMLPHQGELQRRMLNVMGLGHLPGTF
jgi:hypothetical protein